MTTLSSLDHLIDPLPDIPELTPPVSEQGFVPDDVFHPEEHRKNPTLDYYDQ